MKIDSRHDSLAPSPRSRDEIDLISLVVLVKVDSVLPVDCSDDEGKKCDDGDLMKVVFARKDLTRGSSSRDHDDSVNRFC